MNTVKKKILIIGNGFDLDLGRQTSYKNFYESKYCPNDYPAPIIKHLNEKWHGDLEAVKWYDLENEILNYYEKIKNKDNEYDLYNESERVILESILPVQPIEDKNELIQKNTDIIERLLEDSVLFKHENRIIVTKDALLSPVVRDKKALLMIKQGLIGYLREIEKSNTAESSVAAIVARAFVWDYRNREDYLVYSFNYMNMYMDKFTFFNSAFNEITEYVHGSINNEDIIIGTKDYPIDERYDFIQKSFDPKFNPPAMVYDLLDSDDVTIFGHSLGVNDSQYFKPFFMQQVSAGAQKKNITIFTKDEHSELQIKRALQLMTNYNLSALRSMNNLQIIKTDECEINKDILRLYVERISGTNDGFNVDSILTGYEFEGCLYGKINQRNSGVPIRKIIGLASF
jgi:hypothetical protein